MEVMTRDFGKVIVNKEEVIHFPQGIPGFLDKKDYILLPLAEESPFIVMQSVEDSKLAFITIEPGNIVKDYEFKIDKTVEEKLQIREKQDVIILGITTVKDDIKNMTINLSAPVVINIKEKLGKQIILDSDKYPIRYKPFHNQEGHAEKVAEQC